MVDSFLVSVTSSRRCVTPFRSAAMEDDAMNTSNGLQQESHNRRTNKKITTQFTSRDKKALYFLIHDGYDVHVFNCEHCFVISNCVSLRTIEHE